MYPFHHGFRSIKLFLSSGAGEPWDEITLIAVHVSARPLAHPSIIVVSFYAKSDQGWTSGFSLFSSV